MLKLIKSYIRIVLNGIGVVTNEFLFMSLKETEWFKALSKEAQFIYDEVGSYMLGGEMGKRLKVGEVYAFIDERRYYGFEKIHDADKKYDWTLKPYTTFLVLEEPKHHVEFGLNYWTIKILVSVDEQIGYLFITHSEFKEGGINPITLDDLVLEESLISTGINLAQDER